VGEAEPAQADRKEGDVVNRTEKAQAVETMATAFAQAPHVFVTGTGE
jgi:hypothetical protein